MYDRAPRIFSFQRQTGTNENVGPGSYSPENIRKYRYDIGYAPFDSLAERKFDFALPDGENHPAPCEYEPHLDNLKAKGCSSVRNRALRFPPYKPFGPGPNAYHISLPWAGKKIGPCGLLVPDYMLESNKNMAKQRELYELCEHPTFVRFRDVPSIPSGPFVYCYEEAPDGRMLPIEGPPKTDHPGPEKYFPKIISCINRKKGSCWSKFTDERKPLYVPVHDVAPNQYDPAGDSWAKLAKIARERNAIEAEHELRVPRYMEKVVETARKENFPGPQAYTVTNFALKNNVRYGPDGKRICTAPFNVSSQRFQQKSFPGPGPNTYHLQDDWKKPTEKVPFNTSDRRFKEEKHSGPGPDSYIPQNSLADEIGRRKKSHSGVAFGSSARRFPPENQTVDGTDESSKPASPGPAQYDVGKCGESFTCELKGETIGTAKVEKKEFISDAPAPGTYNVAESFALTHCKRCAAPPFSKEGKERQQKFLSSAERFDKNSFFNVSDHDLPGPADYCIPGTLNDKTGKFVYQSDRFKSRPNDSSPGPAHYPIAPAVQSSLRLNTFNAILSGRHIRTSSARRRQ